MRAQLWSWLHKAFRGISPSASPLPHQAGLPVLSEAIGENKKEFNRSHSSSIGTFQLDMLGAASEELLFPEKVLLVGKKP